MNTFKDFYETVRIRMEKNIAGWGAAQAKSRNPIIQGGFDRFLKINRGGKRLRGTLAYLGFHIMGHDDLAGADALAESFELFQTAILIHDDIIDHADSRRGIETIHTSYFREFTEGPHTPQDEANARETGCSLALCLGDAGLYMAEERLVEGYGGHPLLARLLSYYHKIILHTIEGELLDVQLPYLERRGLREDGQADSLDAHIYDIYHLKTACYTAIGPLCSGMLLGGASPELLRQMEDMADDLGIAFQIQDDILGIYSDEKSLGKNIGSDISEYKQTLLYSYVKNQGGEACERLRQYYGKPDITDAELRAVQEIFRESGALEAAEGKAAEFFASARDKLDRIEGIPEEKKQIVRGFIDYLQTRKS